MFKVAGRLLKSASVGVRRGICDLTPRGSGFSKAKTMVESAVRCRGLVKRYGNVTAVDGLDLDVRSGECFGMLGPNGAGKTTTVEIFEGLREADAGDVEVLGDHWRGDGLCGYRRAWGSSFRRPSSPTS
jgi:ABC-type glutathione transport system ATPase component